MSHYRVLIPTVNPARTGPLLKTVSPFLNAEDSRGTLLGVVEMAPERSLSEGVEVARAYRALLSRIARYAERFRAAQLEALPGLLERHGLSPDTCPPAVLAVLLASVSRMVVMEQALGMSIGHAETLAFVERHLSELEG